MPIVDASCLYEVVAEATLAERVRAHLASDADHGAPHVIDAEVLAIVQRDRLLGRLDETAARQAVDDLWAWPGERYGHRSLLHRAWELRATVRSWDALDVALAEALGATLFTLDAQLGTVPGLECEVEVVGEA
jgi:predicted nucleic acid-binding protein